ncbi:hypothetical protein I6F35_05145 [Bradyrhizobium sp. BRP22]|uniref:hypothetical protein n=1 Tax=Bradyrhizobium sp. BRP22 TaxID=2793821 RepID=UPI001CD71A53|nr:hypothetical protein [Bradyrhizobium sp. BRP22]MCA1452605.1 hypothetical protein [Bradyrhizobium sp. BRP22]
MTMMAELTALNRGRALEEYVTLAVFGRRLRSGSRGGAGWILPGTSLRHGLGGTVGSAIGYRLSAVVLAVLAGMIGVHSLVIA